MKTKFNDKRKHLMDAIKTAHAAAMEKLRLAYCSPESLSALFRIDQNLCVELSERMTTRGGLAIMRKIGSEYQFLLIRINARLHELHPHELVNTYLHELAHIVANVMTNRNEGHGGYWPMVMKVLGLPAERCHKMDTSALAGPPRRYKYSCISCSQTYSLTSFKHNKQTRALENNRRGYFCRCGKDIKHCE